MAWGRRLLSKLRERFSRNVWPLLRLLSSMGIRPNYLTYASLCLSIFSALCIVNRLFVHSAVLIGLSGLLDALDGALARFRDEVTTKGALLDSVLDRYADLIVISSLYWSGVFSELLVALSIIGTIMVSYVRAKCESLGLGIGGTGIMERGERILFLAAIFLVACLNHPVANLLLGVFAALTNATAIQRIVEGCRIISKAEH